MALWNWFKPPVKYFYWPFQGGTSFAVHLCFLCLVFLILSRQFIAALWSPAGKGLSSWLLLVMFNIFFLLISNVVPWVRCGTWLYRVRISAVFLTLWDAHYKKNVVSYKNFRNGFDTLLSSPCLKIVLDRLVSNKVNNFIFILVFTQSFHG